MATQQGAVLSDTDLQWLALGNALGEPAHRAASALKAGLRADWKRVFNLIHDRFTKLADDLKTAVATGVVQALRASSEAERADLEETVRLALARGDGAIFDLFEVPLAQLAMLLEDVVVAPSLHPRIKAAINLARRAMREKVQPPEEDLLGVAGDHGLKFPGFGNTAPQESRMFEVWYGTNRKPLVSDGLLKGYSSERDTEMHLGRCAIEIPAAHDIGGRSSWWKRLTRGNDRLRLVETVAQEQADFWREINERLASVNAGPADAVVFLHGYNVSFEEAAVCAAQIGADLALPGMMAFFSWPSRGRLFSYSADEATIEASEEAIIDFLKGFRTRSGARRVHLIAHSMGNRGLLRAVHRISQRVATGKDRPFGQVILAAPDVDSGLFSNLASVYPLVSDRTTLYVSARDRAVFASRLLHRVGFTPPICIFPGIDTISVTKVDLTKLGHGYVASSREILSDMYNILMNSAPPERRATLILRNDDRGNKYWAFAS